MDAASPASCRRTTGGGRLKQQDVELREEGVEPSWRGCLCLGGREGSIFLIATKYFLFFVLKKDNVHLLHSYYIPINVPVLAIG